MPVGTIPIATACVTLFFCTIIGTYALYVHQGNKAWLPEISDTWVHPPGTQISRIGVGVGCSGLAWLQVCIWWADGKRTALRSAAIFSIFLLSIVGAVCESSTADTCRGNQILHSVSAVVFFIIYDVYALFISFRKDCPVSSVLAIASSLTKLRWLPAVYPHSGLDALLGDPIIIAYIEWIDVSLIMLWSLYFMCRHCRDLSLKIGTTGSTDDSPVAEWSMPWFAYYNVLALGGVSFAAPLAIFMKDHAVSDTGLPALGSLWVTQPGNWFGHWGACQGAVAICALALALDRGAVLLVSLFSAASLVLMGAVTQHEFPDVHNAVSIAFFLASTLRMLLSLRGSAGVNWVLVLVTAMSTIRLIPWLQFDESGSVTVVLEYCNWCGILAWWVYRSHANNKVSYQLHDRASQCGDYKCIALEVCPA